MTNVGFLINGPPLTLLPGFPTLASRLVSLHPSPCLHLPVISRSSSRAWIPSATCFPSSAKGQLLGSDFRTRTGRETWVFEQEGQGRGVSARGKRKVRSRETLVSCPSSLTYPGSYNPLAFGQWGAQPACLSPMRTYHRPRPSSFI